MADSSLVLTELDSDGVLLLTLNRPERRNAWCAPLEAAFFEALDRAVSDPAVRAVVLTGAGGSWCPGMDVAQIAPSGPSALGARRPQTFLRLIPKLVVAAVDGPCAGIGFIQALMCDVRFTTPEAKWTTAFAKIGLCAEDGLAWLLERSVGLARATDLLLSSRVVRGSEAAAIGLATDVVASEDLLAHSLAYAREVATQCSPLSVALAKKALLAATTSSLEESRISALRQLWEAKQADDYEIGVAAFRERRRPQFPGLPAQYGLLEPLGPAQRSVERGGPPP